MYRAAFIKQDISRFDIAMDHALLVGKVNSATDGQEKMDDISGRRKLSLSGGVVNVVCQRLPFDIIHDHVGNGTCRLWRLRNLEVVDLHNIGMMQRSHHPGFTDKTFHKIWIVL